MTQNLPVLSIQELNAPNNFDSVFNLAQGPPPPVFATPGPNGRFPLPERRLRARLLRTARQNVPALDAWNVTVQRQLTTRVGRAGIRGQPGSHDFTGNGPAENKNSRRSRATPTLRETSGGLLRRPVGERVGRRHGAPYGWTQGLDFSATTWTTDYKSLQAKITRRFAGGWSLLAHYTYQKAKNNDGDYFFIDPDLNWTAGLAPHPQLRGVDAGRAAVRQGRRVLSESTPKLLGGWQVNTNVFIPSGLPFDVGYAGAGADRDVGPNRPDLIGDPDGRATGARSQWFNATPIGAAGSAFGRPARGDLRQHGAQLLTGPGWWNVDASLFKRFTFGERNLECGSRSRTSSTT